MLVALCVVAGLTPVWADEAEDLQRDLSTVQRQQEATRAQLEQLLRQQARLRAVIDALREQLRGATADLEGIQRQMAALQALVDEAAARARVAEEGYRRHRAAFQDRVRAMYKSGLGGWLTFMLGAQSFSELLERVAYLHTLNLADTRTAHELALERQQLEDQRSVLQRARDVLKPLQDELAARQAQVARAVEEQGSYESELERSRRVSLQQLAGLRAQERALVQALDRWREQQSAKNPPKFGRQCPPAPPPGFVQFCGHGWGHGVGLGQWGAMGMAKAGWDYARILTHFYSGAQLTTIPTDAVIRIWLRSPGARSRAYRGRIVIDSAGRAINYVPLEDYLRGLGEVPSSWPLEAIKAQVVAARCYAVAHLGARGSYDMDDTTRYQVYGGIAYESGPQNAAVDQTRGRVLMWNGSVIVAFYSASDGGHTANVEDIFRGAGPVPYLRGVRDNFDVEAPLHTWYTDTYPLRIIEEIYFTPDDVRVYGHLQRIDLSSRDPSDRLNRVALVGTRATMTLPVERFMAIFNSPATRQTGRDALWSDLFGTTPGPAIWPYW